MPAQFEMEKEELLRVLQQNQENMKSQQKVIEQLQLQIQQNLPNQSQTKASSQQITSDKNQNQNRLMSTQGQREIHVNTKKPPQEQTTLTELNMFNILHDENETDQIEEMPEANTQVSSNKRALSADSSLSESPVGKQQKKDESVKSTERAQSTQQVVSSLPHRLKPVKLRLVNKAANDKTSVFKTNKLALKQEVIKMKNLSISQAKEIKFVEFDSTHPNVVKIVTDNNDLHSILSKEWPADAFGGGAQLITSNTLKPKIDNSLELIIKGVDLEIVLENYTDQLAEQGIISATRLLKRAGDSAPSTVVKLKMENEEKYTQLANKHIQIDWFRFKTETHFRPVQCFKCQRFDHDQRNCRNEIACLRCGKAHHHSECKNDSQLCCVNCGGNHAAVSRSCRTMRQETRLQFAQKSQPAATVQLQNQNQNQSSGALKLQAGNKSSINHSRPVTFASALANNYPANRHNSNQHTPKHPNKISNTSNQPRPSTTTTTNNEPLLTRLSQLETKMHTIEKTLSQKIAEIEQFTSRFDTFFNYIATTQSWLETLSEKFESTLEKIVSHNNQNKVNTYTHIQPSKLLTSVTSTFQNTTPTSQASNVNV